MRKTTIGIPIKVLHETEGHIIKVKLNNEVTYKGRVESVDDFMNIILSNVTETNKLGEKKNSKGVYLSGNEISFVYLPDILLNSMSIINQNRQIEDKKEEKRSKR